MTYHLMIIIEYCRLSYEVYNQITMTTDVEATIILTELASAVTRGTSLQLRYSIKLKPTY